MILRLSIATQLSTNLPFAWIQFSFFFDEQMNWFIFRYKSIKSVKIKINRWTKRVCHRFLPIERRNWYQLNQIYRLTNRYRFLSIDYSGCIRFHAFTCQNFYQGGGWGGGENTRLFLECEQKHDQAKSKALENHFWKFCRKSNTRNFRAPNETQRQCLGLPSLPYWVFSKWKLKRCRKIVSL